MTYKYWGFDDEFRGPREYARSPTHTAQTKQNAFKGAYRLIMKDGYTSVRVYNETTKRKYDVFEDPENRGFWNVNGRKVPKKTIVIYDKTDKTYHILKSDGTLGKKIDKVRA